MAAIKVRDLAYGRLRAPLDAQEEFLTAFGIVAGSLNTGGSTCAAPISAPIHVTKKGDPGFIGFAWAVSSEENLRRIRRFPARPGLRTPMNPVAERRCASPNRTAIRSE